MPSQLQGIYFRVARGCLQPLFIYGGVGLGKTHLMHAVGNKIKTDDPSKKVVYVHSERFVGDMVKSLQLGAINEFKEFFYRSVDALLIDDISFAGKEQSPKRNYFILLIPYCKEDNK